MNNEIPNQEFIAKPEIPQVPLEEGKPINYTQTTTVINILPISFNGNEFILFGFKIDFLFKVVDSLKMKFTNKKTENNTNKINAQRVDGPVVVGGNKHTFNFSEGSKKWYVLGAILLVIICIAIFVYYYTHGRYNILTILKPLFEAILGL